MKTRSNMEAQAKNELKGIQTIREEYSATIHLSNHTFPAYDVIVGSAAIVDVKIISVDERGIHCSGLPDDIIAFANLIGYKESCLR